MALLIAAAGARFCMLSRSLSPAIMLLGHPAGDDQVTELALFPEDRLNVGSICFLAADVFGCDRLNNVTAKYTIDNSQLTAFVAVWSSAQEAAGLSQAYYRFLIENGGADRELSVSIPGARLVQIFDTFEVIFTQELSACRGPRGRK